MGILGLDHIQKEAFDVNVLPLLHALMNPEYNAIKHNSILTTIFIMIISQMKIILLRG